MSAGVAPSPSICWMGSPGTRWMSRKTSDTTSQTTGSVSARRVRICFMGSLLTINQWSGVRDQGSGIRGQSSGIRDQGSGVRGQGSEISDRGDVFYWLNADAGDAAGIHFDDRQTPAFEVDAFAFPGNVAEAHEQEAG